MNLPINRKLPLPKNTSATMSECHHCSRLDLRQYRDMLLALIVGCAVALIVILSTYFVENPKLAFGLIGGPAFVLMTMGWPEMGVLALVAMTGGLVNFYWLPLLGFGAYSIHLQEIFLGVLCALAVARLMTRDDYPLITSPLMIPVFLFLAALVLSIINGVAVHDLALSTAIQRGRSVGLWALFFPVIQLVRDRRATERLSKGLWGLTAVLALGVAARQLYPSLHPFLFPVDSETLRTMGTEYSNVARVFNFWGGPLLYAMIPVTIATLAFSNHEQMTTRWHIVLLILLALLLNWLVRSFQRSLWISTALNCGLLFLFISPRERVQCVRRLVPLIMLALLVLVVYQAVFPYEFQRLSGGVSDRLMSLTTNSLGRSDESVSWRLLENRYAVDSIKSSPLLGVGIGNEYRPPFEREILWNEYGLRWFIHNTYLWIVVTMGLAGLLPFLAMCALFVLRGLFFWRQITDNRLRALYLGLALSFLGQMISNITAPTFLDGPPQSIYPAIMGLSESILYISRQERILS